MKRIVLMLLLVATAAYGEIYRWTDSKGTTHYTNSLYEIPERYRAKAKTVNLGIPEAKTDQSTAQQATPTPVASPQAQPPPAQSPQSLPSEVAPKTERQTAPIARKRPHRRSSDEEE